ncbi:MAG: hypothetical protein ACOYKE_06010 [Ferruginibacter sp.]
MYLEWIRKKMYWLTDALRGGIVKKHHDDIKRIVSNPQSHISINSIAIRENAILLHTLQQVPYYATLLQQHENCTVEDFPVIDKNIIRENFDLFFANGVNKESLIRVVTSGSTGTPFSVYHDVNKKKRNSADTIYFGSLAGFEIGTQLNYLKIWTQVNKKSALKTWFENIVPIDVTQLSDANIELLLNRFNQSKKPQAFLGYASALESICRYIENSQTVHKKINKVSAAITMSEGLSAYGKAAIHKYFGVHGVSRYSNVENGIIAQQLPNGSTAFIVNWASYKVEILDLETNQPLPLGTVGKIVVTDYFNYAMPMIRYDTGDIGALDWDEQKHRIVLSKVEGRKMDSVFNTNGTLVSSFTITNNMWLYPELKQYQFIQTGKKSYLFKLNLEGKFEREALLISEFKKYFGEDATIAVEYVDEIPLLNSGKRKKVMNISQ